MADHLPVAGSVALAAATRTGAEDALPVVRRDRLAFALDVHPPRRAVPLGADPDRRRPSRPVLERVHEQVAHHRADQRRLGANDRELADLQGHPSRADLRLQQSHAVPDEGLARDPPSAQRAVGGSGVVQQAFDEQP